MNTQATAEHEPSYWAATTRIAPPGPRLTQEISTDVAIIGAGYTGLSTAYHMAKDYGRQPVVLEANRIGWGCSGRNGGFAMIGVGKDGYDCWIRKHGIDAARRAFDMGRQAVRLLRSVMAETGVDAASPNDGYLYLAHRANRMSELRSTQRLLREAFSFETELLDRDAVHACYLKGTEIHGALSYPEHFPIHPMKWAQGLGAAVKRHGVPVYENSGVIEWRREQGRHVLVTEQGLVKAQTVVIATNGYTPDGLHPLMKGRLMNVLSNILVTAPLTAQQLRDTQWQTHRMLVDTRSLRFYFRLMEDNRIMFGARGGVDDTPATDRQMRAWLYRRLVEQFPPLAGIDVAYFWRGLVSIARDKNPHVYASPDGSVVYSLAYAGTGVALSTYCGRQIAQALAGKGSLAQLPLVGSPLPAFEVPALRKLYQRLAYGYFFVHDEFL